MRDERKTAVRETIKIVAQRRIQPPSKGSDLFAVIGGSHGNEVAFDLHFIDPSLHAAKPSLSG